MSPPDEGNMSQVRQMLAEAEAEARERALTEALCQPAAGTPPPPQEPPPPDDEGGGDDGGYVAYDGHLPADCPVIALGMMGDVYWYLDALGQLRSLKAKDHSRLNVQALFGEDAREYLRRHWASLKEVLVRTATGSKETKWIITGWKPELVAEALMAQAARRGVWSPQERVRGPGAWKGPDGGLILHLGDVLLCVDKDGQRREIAPGLVDGYVYPSGRKGLRPAEKQQPGGADGPAAQLKKLYQRWALERGETDAHLMLGLSVAAMIGGALDRRPVHWTTGGYGTGKSTLQDAQRWLHGPGGALQTADATAAGVRQTVRYSSFPVWLDEAEAREDNRKLAALLELARSAHTGAMAVRGGQDHENATFNLYSVIGFSSILMPPMKPQDLSRMLIFRLGPLSKDGKAPAITEAKMAELGARLLRRVIDQWHLFPAAVEAYRDAMARGGHSARGQDVFGTVLACAHIAMHDDVPSVEGDIEPWAERLPASGIAEAQPDADEQSCLTHLMTCVVECPNDRKRLTVAEWVRMAAAETTDSMTHGEKDDVGARAAKAEAVLGSVGMRVQSQYLVKYLAVANQSTGLNRLMQGTHWHSAADTTGVWVQTLRRLAGAVTPEAGRDGKPKKIRIGGYPSRALLVPLSICLPDGDSHPHAQHPASARTPPPGQGQTPGADGGAAYQARLQVDQGWPPGPDPGPWPDGIPDPDPL